MLLLAMLLASLVQNPVQAELFGAGVFSTGDYELPPTFDLDGNRAWFTVSTPQYGRIRWIVETRRSASGWSTPVMASFSGQYDDADPWLSPDGRQLFFLSKRPVAPGQPPKRDLDIWVMQRQGDGWSQPRHLGDRVNGPSDEHYVTATRDGRLLIAAVRPDSRNQGDLYEVAIDNGEYGAPVNLGPVVNGPDTHETTPWISPDGNTIIFGARGRPDALGQIDLYVTTRDPATGAWGVPVNLGRGVNSAGTDYCPIVSPDGEWLYFSSTRSFIDNGLDRPIPADSMRAWLRGPGNGLGDTWRIRVRDVPALARLRLR